MAIAARGKEREGGGAITRVSLAAKNAVLVLGGLLSLNTTASQPIPAANKRGEGERESFPRRRTTRTILLLLLLLHT